MPDLSDDEFTVLLIAEQGQAMIPAGRWNAPVLHLVELGYLRPLGNPGDPTGSVNNIITEQGRSALKVHGDEVDKQLTRVFREGALKRQFIEGSPLKDTLAVDDGRRWHPAKSNTCPKCERALNEQWQFCPECGTQRA